MPANKSIIDVINDYLASNTLDVPVFHVVALKLQQVLRRPNFSIDEVTQLISADPALASQVLRMANSSFYSGLSKVATIRDALVRLGAQEVANIAMLATQQDAYRSQDPLSNRSMQMLWKHALCTALGARWLAGKVGYDSLAQEAFLAGLLHDIGKLFLLKILEDLSRTGRLGCNLSPELVGEVLNSMHVEQGTLLMQRWNMPDVYCEVVRDHHLEQWKQNNPLLALVRLVNLACNKLGIGLDPDPSIVLFATTEAQALGVKEITLAELEITIEDAAQKAQPSPK